MRFIACYIDASLQDFPFPFGVSRPPKSVRDWSGILCELFGSGLWGRERDFRAGAGFGSGWGLSEQRYSGKPDGVAGTPKSINKQKKAAISDNFFVGVARLERATACTPCKNASQLHHTPRIIDN